MKLKQRLKREKCSEPLIEKTSSHRSSSYLLVNLSISLRHPSKLHRMNSLSLSFHVFVPPFSVPRLHNIGHKIRPLGLAASRPRYLRILLRILKMFPQLFTYLSKPSVPTCTFYICTYQVPISAYLYLLYLPIYTFCWYNVGQTKGKQILIFQHFTSP